MCLLQALAQQAGKEAVVPVPAALVVQGKDEQIGPFQLLQRCLAVILTGDGVAQGAGQVIQQGGVEQESLEAVGLAVHEDPRAARGISKTTAAGEYRPLKSSPNLRRGWELLLADAGELFVAMNYLYPAGVVHWHLLREGELEITRAMLARGRYVPHVDHFVSQDCTWRHFSYYRRRLNQIIDEA